MSAQTSIEWTATVHPDGSVTPGSTWNPVRGCVKVSPGCAHCYAETFAERFRGVKGHPYEQGFDVRLVPEKLDEPLHWKKPRRVFVNSMSDLFQDGVPAEYIDRVFAVMALAPQHTFQVLTKRAERMQKYLTDAMDADDITVAKFEITGETWDFCNSPRVTLPLPNVWLGVSVENQHFADERIPLLLQTPAAVRFISAEPLLEPVNVGLYLSRDGMFPMPGFRDPLPGLNWVIVGGESSPSARLFNVEWARSIIAQCKAAGVPCFVKQLGRHPYDNRSSVPEAPPYEFFFEDKKGGDMAEWPADLRVREFPAGHP
jgi:protein gp37